MNRKGSLGAIVLILFIIVVVAVAGFLIYQALEDNTSENRNQESENQQIIELPELTIEATDDQIFDEIDYALDFI